MYAATRGPVSVHGLSLNQVDIHHCWRRRFLILTLTNPNTRWGEMEVTSISVPKQTCEKLSHVRKAPTSQIREVFLLKVAMGTHQCGFEESSVGMFWVLS
jgi:hypothetical protein